MNKYKLLEVMRQFDTMTLSTAYMYAKNLTLYGVDVTEKWVTATEQSANLEKAYHDGYYDALKQKDQILEIDGYEIVKTYLEKLKVDIENYDYFILCANGQKGIHIDKVLEMIDNLLISGGEE